MKVQELFGQTLRDAPSEAEIPSHKLLIRGAFLRRTAAGVYAWLPLGLRVLRRLENVIREEMDTAGAQELLMAGLTPAEFWQRSGRWASGFGGELYKLTDTSGRDWCLGATHEEVMAFLASTELGSYRDLPAIAYQIQWKFRDAPRPRGGLLRAREFLMKDAYSFDADEAGLAKSYDKMMAAYQKSFERCDLSTVMIEANPGAMGGRGRNHEFIQPAENGEDTFVHCPACGYAANTEVAASRSSVDYKFRSGAVEKVHTPGQTTIEAVSSFLNSDSKQLVKSLLLETPEGIVCALVPGDRDLNEFKLRRALGVTEARLMTEHEFEKRGIAKGFTGPVGLMDANIVADESLRGGAGLIVGANEADYHLKGVDEGRDFSVDIWADLVSARTGDLCMSCGAELTLARGIEVGHIFELGTKFSVALDATYSDAAGNRKPVVMGSYGWGVSRMVAAVVESHCDDRGIIWPKALAPFQVAILVLTEDGSAAASQLQKQLGGDAIIDDRAGVSAGVKFADADLIGYPIQVVIGRKYAETGKLEVKVRHSGERLEAGTSEAEIRAILESCP